MNKAAGSTPRNFKLAVVTITTTTLFLWLTHFTLIRQCAYYDYAIISFLANHPMHSLAFRLLSAVTLLADTKTAIALLILAALVSIRQKSVRRVTLLLTLEMGLAALIEIFMKRQFDHILPPGAPDDPSIAAYGFPSGHAMLSVCFYGLFFHHVYRQSPPAYRQGVIICAALAALLIGGSRVLLRVHYLSDVLGGYLIAVPLLVLGIVLYDKGFSKDAKP